MSLNLEIESGAVIRVLVVDDSAFMRTALSRMIGSEPDFEVVGTACSGSEALAKIVTLNPDVITLDVQMPGIDGLETLRCIMNQFPRPVIMVSTVTERDAQATFIALGAGAFDYVPKQLSPTSLDITHIRADLVAKIRAAGQSRKIRPPAVIKKPSRPSSVVDVQSRAVPPAIVALGASTGGPKALQEMLPLLPRDLSVPILIVQHMPVGFTAAFAQRLNSLSAVEVHEAVDDERIKSGVVYIAPAGIHMTVRRSRDSALSIHLDPNPNNHLHRPSVDVMMKSVAENFGNLALGVILTGMGSDGALGMNAIRLRGGVTIGQDEASCTVYGMPRACAELGALGHVLPLFEIPTAILDATRSRRRA